MSGKTPAPHTAQHDVPWLPAAKLGMAFYRLISFTKD